MTISFFSYRDTPNTNTNRSPSELIFKQLRRTKLTLLRPIEAGRKNKNEGKRKRSREYCTVNEKIVHAYMTLEKMRIPGKIVKLLKVILTLCGFVVILPIHVDHLEKANTSPINLPTTNLSYSSPQCRVEETEKSNLPVLILNDTNGDIHRN